MLCVWIDYYQSIHLAHTKEIQRLSYFEADKDYL